MERRAAAVRRGEIPAIDCSRLIGRNPKNIAAYRRSGRTVGDGITDSYFRLTEPGHFFEFQANPDCFPLLERPADSVSLLRGDRKMSFCKKTIVQDRSVHPLGICGDDCCGTCWIRRDGWLQRGRGSRQHPAKRPDLSGSLLLRCSTGLAGGRHLFSLRKSMEFSNVTIFEYNPFLAGYLVPCPADRTPLSATA